MSDYVLVHGAWCGGWVYDRLAAELRGAGHRVLVATLTGLGDRADELVVAVDLTTHINDVIEQVRSAGLGRFILAGHSYGGMIVSGVASFLGPQIDALIYIDGYVPEDGQSVWDQNETWVRELYIQLQRDTPGLLAPPPMGDHLPLVPHPLLTYLQPVRLSGEEKNIGRKTYIYANGYQPTLFTRYSEKFKNDKTGHITNSPADTL